MSATKFTIIYDTYCGWCYGAAPVFDALLASGAEVEALHRHLFQGDNAYRMSDGKGEHILQADKRIAELTGQTFSQTYIDNVVLSDTEILDSGYTAQAAALVHASGIQKEFAVRERLEKARYIDGDSAFDRAAVVNALLAEDVPEHVAQLIGTPSAQLQAQATSIRAQKLMQKVGSGGVPTVLKINGDDVEVIDHSRFYGAPEKISELVTAPVKPAH